MQLNATGSIIALVARPWI